MAAVGPRLTRLTLLAGLLDVSHEPASLMDFPAFMTLEDYLTVVQPALTSLVVSVLVVVGSGPPAWLAAQCPNLDTLHLVGAFCLPRPNANVAVASICLNDGNLWADPWDEFSIGALARALPGLEELVLSPPWSGVSTAGRT